MNEVNRKTKLMILFYSIALLSSTYGITQQKIPSKNQNNEFILKAEAKRQRKMARNKAAL